MEIFSNTRICAYFIWECTKNNNALNMWHCAEDIAYSIELIGLKTEEELMLILRKGYESEEYIEFVRIIAFRLYLYTNREDKRTNWYDAEKLIKNPEWRNSCMKMAIAYRNSDMKELNNIRSVKIKQYYQTK